MPLNLVPTRQPLGRNPLIQVVLPLRAVETLDTLARREGASRWLFAAHSFARRLNA